MSQRYKVISRLGRGGVGTVDRCLDTQLNREVAVKRLLPIEKTRLNEPATESLEREAIALSALHHPNVVTIFEFGEDEDGPFVVTELIEGESLEKCIKLGAVSMDDFAELTTQMLDALITAQDMNLSHRDLKPANIMLKWLPSGRFQVKVLDFGLSKFNLEATKQTLDVKGHFLCSIDYVAPEQIDRKPIDHRVDLYSLACVLYFSLTQEAPFKDESGPETLKRHLANDYTPIREIRPDVPQPVAHWLERMMSLDPDDRPENALIAQKEFFAAHQNGISPFGSWKANAKASIANAVPTADQEKIIVTPRPTGATTESVTENSISPTVPIQHHHSTPSGKRLLTGAVAPRPQTGSTSTDSNALSPSKTNASHPMRAKSEKQRKLLMPLIGLGCAVALGIGILAFALQERDQKATTQPKIAQATSVATAGEALSADNSLEQLPVWKGLVARFSAAHGTFQIDSSKPATFGSSVLRWEPTDELIQSKLVMFSDVTSDQPTPELIRVGAEAGFNRPHPALQFSDTGRLISTPKSSPDFATLMSKGDGATIFLVMRGDERTGTFARFDAFDPIAKRNLSGIISFSRTTESVRLAANGDLSTASVTSKNPGNGFVILSASWDRANGTLQQFIKQASGATSKPPAVSGAISGEFYLSKFSIGGNGQNESRRPFEGIIAEVIIYNKVLREHDRLEVERHLFNHYFAQ